MVVPREHAPKVPRAQSAPQAQCPTSMCPASTVPLERIPPSALAAAACARVAADAADDDAHQHTPPATPAHIADPADPAGRRRTARAQRRDTATPARHGALACVGEGYARISLQRARRRDRAPLASAGNAPRALRNPGRPPRFPRRSRCRPRFGPPPSPLRSASRGVLPRSSHHGVRRGPAGHGRHGQPPDAYVAAAARRQHHFHRRHPHVPAHPHQHQGAPRARRCHVPYASQGRSRGPVRNRCIARHAGRPTTRATWTSTRARR